MSLYRVLLVDDEEEIREGIKRRIDWTSCGFELVGDASNGVEALDLARTLKPDLVMTDIKMPYMDGLELCRALNQKLPSAKLVVFSGFDDFEYARQAIGANVSEYILKPINAEELTQVLKKLRQQIDLEIAQAVDTQKLRAYYEQSLPMLREQYFARLVEGRIPHQQILEQAQLLGLKFEAPYYTTLLFTADRGGTSQATPELTPLWVKQFIEENASGTFNLLCFLLGDSVAGVAELETRGEIVNLMAAGERICKLIRRYMDMRVTVGIGSPCKKPQELKYSFDGALDAVEYRAIMGSGGAIFIEDLEPDQSIQLQLEEQDERQLYSAIKLGTPDTVRETVRSLLSRGLEAKIPVQQMQIYLTELQSALIKFARSSKLELDEVFGNDFQKLAALASPRELEESLCACCLKMGELIAGRRTASSRIITDKALEYIAMHFSDSDLSVEVLCEHLHVSPAYFSSVFKRETGISFINHLTAIRMEQAARLLQTTEEKTYLIAEQTGYSDANYFSYVFKKYFGISPSRYRGGKQ